MQTKIFQNTDDLTAALVELLARHFKLALPMPHAVLLPGGRTPRRAYFQMTQQPRPVDENTCFLLSDERLAPIRSPESNYGQLRPMLKALRIPAAHILRVDPRQTPALAARHYDRDLRAFFERKGRITLGVLGLGADGHTASLFSMQDVARGRGAYAIAVPRRPGPNRVSVTPDLLAKAECIVFVAAGAEKRLIVERMRVAGVTLPAGLAVAGVADVQVWFAETGEGG
ncbi:MAG: 6-phosphogluconolactonase [Kiritimatiellia bacterium]|jgi:6-phosphogluconolactonase/glucosamine-6-phosphate isomerase/deaminase